MEKIDEFIHEFIRSDKFKERLQEEVVLRVQPITLTYLIERLIITHVKLFMLEDKVRDTTLSDEEIGRLKRKIDYWNGCNRPDLVEGIGELFAKAVKEGNERLVREPNLKDYRAR
jgi:hypothetical protein